MKADQLEEYLARCAKENRMDPFWLISGTDDFLAVEAGDAVRATRANWVIPIVKY